MEIKLFTPHKGQKQVIDGFADSKHKFGIVATGRQYGKSLLGQNLMLYWLLSSSKQKAGWISPIYSQAKKVFLELEAASQPVIRSSNKADLTITFVNGSTIQFLGAERYDSIRGFSFNYLVIDEAAFIRKEAINEAILPTMTAIGKKCLIISTPKSKNWFYNTYLRGTTEDDNYISFRGISTDNPYVDEEFINNQAKSLPADIYAQEYLAQFSEATNDVFRGLDQVCILNEYEAPRRNKRYYYGVDVGIANDYTVLIILDEQGRTCHVERFNGKTVKETGETIIAALKRYNIRGGYIERNNIGLAIFEQVKRANIKCTGFNTTQESKTQGVRTLIQDIEDQVVMLPSKELMPEMYNELAAYTYKVNTNGKLSFSHPNGLHDDVVDSLWLANKARNEMFGGGKSKIYIGGNVKTSWG